MSNQKNSLYIAIIAIIIATIAIGLSYSKTTGPMGPEGPAGVDGPAGPAGPTGPTGSTGPQGTSVTLTAEPESCATCHSKAGSEHQDIYDDYVDESSLVLTIDSVTTIGSTSTMKFTIKKNGVPYIDVDGLPSLEQKRFYAVTYDSTTRMFDNSESFSNIVALGGGKYSVTATDITYKPETSNGLVYAYIADEKLDAATGGRVSLYNDLASAGKAFGDVNTYESAANVTGCEKCHGTPYAKHGYRAAEVTGLSDFASCKTCHYDTRDGGHEDWQIFANDPARFAEVHAGDELTEDEEAQYAYIANIMNDVHMSHAMEFPYPQSMSNCITCHEGKLDEVLSDANFKIETCKSCHPVTGALELDPEDEDGEDTLYDTTEFALETILPSPTHDGMDLDSVDCASCHSELGGFPVFSEIHTGYDKQVYTADGVKYSDVVTVTIDGASVANNKVTIQFSAAESTDLARIDVADIVPTVMVGMYGWDTKDYIIGPHERLTDDNGDGIVDSSRSSEDQRALEYEVGEEHPRFTTNPTAGGSWEVVADLSSWADLIADGTVERLEIAVMAELENADGIDVAIDATSRTLDLDSNKFVDDYYGDIVKVEGCNSCHEALGTTFHGPERGGSIVVCRMCHITKADGSHLEMQSRSLDSYVHAIHSFQNYDIGDIDFSNDVLATKYEIHVEHTIPTFSAKNCEACHTKGTYEVPDQTKSLPGLISASDSVEDRNIGDVPEYATGPASRACGGCHRAELINEDDASGLASFYQHTKTGGYLIEVVDDEMATILKVIDEIMANFE
jgi:OmcA/MtrC family decaheme c-type cytochrome